MSRRYLSLLAAGALCACGLGSAAAAINTPVRIEAGLVSGVPGRTAAVTSFKGIPYAAPPVGELRWKPPQPALPWQGVRKAEQFGSECLRTQRNAVVGNEDCLFLNVWTGAASDKERRPVIVWSYPDGFRGNTAADPMFEGEGLARKGVVVVTSNYRSGVFGFLAHPELSKEPGQHGVSGNYGMLDQIAVLQWVKKNIAAFGGDPNRITIAGQSAGGLSTLILATSPLTKGLFHRAIMESRATGLRNDFKEAEQEGVKYAEEHGAHSLKELRAMPWQKLKEGDRYDKPVIDNYVIRNDFFRMYIDGLQHDVPMIMGSAKDEDGAQPHPNVKLEQFQAQVQRKFGDMSDEFMKLYPATSDAQAGQAKNQAGREDSRMRPYLVATQGKNTGRNKVWLYFWTHAPPGPDSDRQGAFHMSEITYVFDNLYATDRPWTNEDRKIADMMSSYWANFAATGDPNGKGLPQWPAIDPKSKSPTVMEVGDRFGLMPLAEPSHIDFLRRYYMANPATAGRFQ